MFNPALAGVISDPIQQIRPGSIFRTLRVKASWLKVFR
jgi:hypothetical protein